MSIPLKMMHPQEYYKYARVLQAIESCFQMWMIVDVQQSFTFDR